MHFSHFLGAAIALAVVFFTFFAGVTSSAISSTEICEQPPVFEKVIKEYMVFSHGENDLLYPRFYHCSQPRVPGAWTKQGDGSALARVGEQTAKIPAVFVDKLVNHIEQIVSQSEAKYLYPIDFDHGHVSLPKAKYQNRFNTLWDKKDFSSLILLAFNSPDVEILFHSQEYIEPKRPPREFLAGYGSKNFLQASSKIQGGIGSHLQNRLSVFKVQFYAHPKGEFQLNNGTRFDFTLEGFEIENSYLKRIGVEQSSSSVEPD